MKIAEIAKAAGVSVGTVDRVLHNRGRVSAETKAKIEKIIQENGYVPNAMARNLKMSSKLSFGVLIPKLESEGGYWKKIYNGIKQAEKEIAHFNISIYIEEFDREIKNDLLIKAKELLNKKIDAIAFSPIKDEESKLLLSLIGDIPYAFFDSSLENTTPISENVQDAYKSGFCAARLTKLFSPNGNNFICIQMYKNAFNQNQRIKGFIEFFSKSNYSLKTYVYEKEKYLSIGNFLNILIRENNNIDGIFVANHAASIVSDFLKEKENNIPPIIGYDLVDNNRRNLEDENISALISQEPITQGYNTIMDLYKILFLKQKNIKKNEIPINIILKENLC